VRERRSIISSEEVLGLERYRETVQGVLRFDSSNHEELFGDPREIGGRVRGRSSGFGRERRAGSTALRGREARRRADDGPDRLETGGRSR
jgi:hypothetical protein